MDKNQARKAAIELTRRYKVGKKAPGWCGLEKRKCRADCAFFLGCGIYKREDSEDNYGWKVDVNPDCSLGYLVRKKI